MTGTNLTAARSNDRRRALEVARDTLAAAIDAAVSRGDGTVAQLVAQYRATLVEIDDIAAGKVRKVTTVDELAGRRQNRSTGSADSVRAAGRGKSGDG